MGSIWIAVAIHVEASLSFIGLGVAAHAGLGHDDRDGVQYLTTAPGSLSSPASPSSSPCWRFSLLGDGLRDVLDSKSYD